MAFQNKGFISNEISHSEVIYVCAQQMRDHIVTSSFIGWEHTQNDPCSLIISRCSTKMFCWTVAVIITWYDQLSCFTDFSWSTHTRWHRRAIYVMRFKSSKSDIWSTFVIPYSWQYLAVAFIPLILNGQPIAAQKNKVWGALVWVLSLFSIALQALLEENITRKLLSLYLNLFFKILLFQVTFPMFFLLLHFSLHSSCWFVVREVLELL